MQISIITVCYNAEKTLEETLISISQQTRKAIEHIVIDGASLDGTLSIINQYQQSISLLVSEPDNGIYDAMNKGVRLATGDIIGILNADDVYAHPNVLAQVSKIMEEENLDALLGDVAFFDPKDPVKDTRRYRSDRFAPDKIAWGWMPAHPALFLRKSVYDQYGLYKTDYKIAGDYEFVARAFSGNKLKHRHLPEVLVRMREGGVSTGGLKNTLLLNQEVLRACKENGIKTNWLKILSKYPAKILERFVR